MSSRAMLAQTTTQPTAPVVDQSAPRDQEVSTVGRNASPPAIEVHDLSKHYGSIRAVDGISFSVTSGEIFGLLGHNGAGKTTTIRMLTGRARPTGGDARIAGYDLATGMEHVRPLINLVFEEPNLYERMTGRENLRFFCELYGMQPGRVDELLDLVDLPRRRPKGQDLLQWYEAAAADRTRSHQPASRAVPRRADPWPGSRIRA